MSNRQRAHFRFGALLRFKFKAVEAPNTSDPAASERRGNERTRKLSLIRESRRAGSYFGQVSGS